MEVKPIKCVAVGDEGVGKTWLLVSYLTNSTPTEYSTILEPISHMVRYENQWIELRLHDTKGHCDFDRLRPLVYPQTDLFILCFSLMSPASLESIKDKWYPEISQHNPNVPFVLVGTKLDMRDDTSTGKESTEVGTTVVTYEEGLAVAEEIGALKYIECSALKVTNVGAVVEDVLHLLLHPTRKCTIL